MTAPTHDRASFIHILLQGAKKANILSILSRKWTKGKQHTLLWQKVSNSLPYTKLSLQDRPVPVDVVYVLDRSTSKVAANCACRGSVKNSLREPGLKVVVTIN